MPLHRVWLRRGSTRARMSLIPVITPMTVSLALALSLLAGCALSVPPGLALPGLPSLANPLAASCATRPGPAATAPASATVFFAANAYDSYDANAVNTLYALRASDGQVRWSCATSTRFGFDGSPVLAGNTLYAVAGTQDTLDCPPGGRVHGLYALRAGDGKQIWSFAFNAGSSQQPIVADGVVYLTANTYLGHFACGPIVNTPAPGTTAQPQVQGEIYALRASDGALLWHRIIGNGVDNVTLQSGTLVLSSGLPGPAPALMALRASDGTRLWRQPPAGDQPASFLMDGPVIYEATGASVVAIRLMDGHLLWQRNVGDYLEGAIATDGSTIAVAGETSATALRADDGTILWQLPTNQSIAFLSVVGSAVYLTTYPLDGNSSLVYAFPSASGTPLWQASYPGEVEAPPIILGHALYLGARGMTQDRAMIDAFDTRSGKRLWQFQNADLFSALSSAGTDTLYLASIGVTTSSTTQWSDLTAVRASDGAVLWRVRVPHSNVLLSQMVEG